MIGQIHKDLAGLGITVFDPPQTFGIVFGGCSSFQFDGLIALNPCRFVDVAGKNSFEPQIFLRPDDKVGFACMKPMKPVKIHIPPIQHINGVQLENDPVQDVDIMAKTVGDFDCFGQ